MLYIDFQCRGQVSPKTSAYRLHQTEDSVVIMNIIIAHGSQYYYYLTLHLFKMLHSGNAALL